MFVEAYIFVHAYCKPSRILHINNPYKGSTDSMFPHAKRADSINETALSLFGIVYISNSQSYRTLSYFLHEQEGDHGFNCLKKSLPLSSTKMKAGKSSTVIFQIASIPNSGYSTHSMLLMLLFDNTAATPPMVPR
mgnify:CR=1 FL=1